MDRPIDIWGGGRGGVQQLLHVHEATFDISNVDSDMFVDRNKRDGKFWTR